jgi:signal transduction histidine kinase
MNKQHEYQSTVWGGQTAFAGFNNYFLAQTGAHPVTRSGALTKGVTHIVETRPNAAVMEERRRLAREIHDTIAQGFAGILLHIEAAQISGNDGSSVISECLACAKELAKNGLEDARRMLLGLRPKSLEGTTLPDALGQLAKRFSRDCGIYCKYRGDGHERELPEEIQNELYRVAQEALCNVRKHSRATSAWLSLNYGPGAVVLKIKDNGQGFAKSHVTGQGYGLATMRERAERLAGGIEINTTPGTGAEFTIIIPVPDKILM